MTLWTDHWTTLGFWVEKAGKHICATEASASVPQKRQQVCYRSISKCAAEASASVLQKHQQVCRRSVSKCATEASASVPQKRQQVFRWSVSKCATEAPTSAFEISHVFSSRHQLFTNPLNYPQHTHTCLKHTCSSLQSTTVHDTKVKNPRFKFPPQNNKKIEEFSPKVAFTLEAYQKIVRQIGCVGVTTQYPARAFIYLL
jgi:hypothetical protein